MSQANIHPKVAQFIQHCRVECGLSANTQASYEADLKRLDFRIKAPDEWTEADVAEHVRRLTQSGLSAASVKRHLMSMRRFFEFVGTDVARDVRSPKIGLRLPRCVAPAVLAKVIDAIEDPIERLVIDLLYGSGLRASEVCTVNMHDDMIRVMGKGRKERIVPCTPWVRRHLGCGDIALMELRRINRKKAYAIVKRCGRRVGVNLTAHTLRHCFATHMLINGADLRVIQEMMGHETVETTQVYTHLDTRHKREVIERCHPRERKV